jgi:pantoate--beta-alanine ligase
MQFLRKVSALKNRIRFLRSRNLSIGFVPTMGALHAGHISLVEASVKSNVITVCSIFVNPAQFNNSADLEKYPRMVQKDIEMLKSAGTNIVFYPDVSEIYPEGLDLDVNIDLQGIDNIWEGEFRPGHFAGVVKVVKRLLDIVEPDELFMGQKDFQQFTIIRHMLRELNRNERLNVVPTMREPDGLAMSSRNMRLSAEARRNSVILYQMLNYAKVLYNKKSIFEIETHSIEEIERNGLNPEYFKLVNADDLSVIDDSFKGNVVAIVAAWAGDVRLIDNMIIQ